MKHQKLAARYARALLDALPDPSMQDRADAMLSGLASVMNSQADVRDALLDPAVGREEKGRLLDAVVDQAAAGAGDFATSLKNFFGVVLDHGRATAPPAPTSALLPLKSVSVMVSGPVPSW